MSDTGIDKLNEMMDEINEENTQEEQFDPTAVENGNSVMFTLEKFDKVLLGKYVEDFNCVITPEGAVFDRKNIENWYKIPYNEIQEKLYTKEFQSAYDRLTEENSEVYKTKQIDEYIENEVNAHMDELSEDRQFLANLFNRNVKNDKIEFRSYKFMMEVLFNKDNIEYDNDVDIAELKDICYNMHTIMNKVSKETYDEICQKFEDIVSM